MFVCFIKMFFYEWMDVLEGVDTNKTSASKECRPCCYWYLKNVGYKFESNVCNKCLDVFMTGYELKKYCNAECKRCWL